MTNPITRAWDALVKLVRPDVDAIIETFVKAQRKLESLIERELQATEAETNAISSLITSRDARNQVINRAYRVIHKLDVLTA